MLGIILYLIFLAIGLYITYLIIKTAVKHAIKESLDDIQIIIKDSIRTTLNERNWNKNNEN